MANKKKINKLNLKNLITAKKFIYINNKIPFKDILVTIISSTENDNVKDNEILKEINIIEKS